MTLVLLALVLLFLVPWLGLLLLIFSLLIFLLIPIGFAARSFAWLILGPRELFRILANRKVRRNHAMEHATINIIQEKTGVAGLSGMAFDDGFSISGMFDPDGILRASREAQRRLSGGEKHLALSRRCGTTIVVVNTISAIVFIFLLFMTGKLAIVPVLLSLLAACILGPVASPWVQRFITTDPDVKSTEITGVETRSRSVRFLGGSVLLPSEIFVHTRIKGEPAVAEVVVQ
ncbi:MAG: DUF6391 domain-containing protein [Thermovirgaceae bacterium]|nr:DUF6391 domain-containing protein [Thermovirgaceae bacterium]